MSNGSIECAIESVTIATLLPKFGFSRASPASAIQDLKRYLSNKLITASSAREIFSCFLHFCASARVTI